MAYHRKEKFKPYPIRAVDEDNINKLELMFLALQKVIKIQKKGGKKGVKVGDNKVTYDELQGMLYALHTHYGMQGAFTNRKICCGCEKFLNSGTVSGQLGYCNGAKEKWCFDTCDKVGE